MSRYTSITLILEMLIQILTIRDVELLLEILPQDSYYGSLVILHNLWKCSPKFIQQPCHCTGAIQLSLEILPFNSYRSLVTLVRT